MKNYLIHPFKEQLIENFFDGEVGNKGPDGYIGETGEVGYKGLIGKVGLDGLQGAKGIPGEMGLLGDKGDPGDQGKPGAKGIKGEKGVNGPKGDIGYKGDLGERGDPGERGVKGVKGVKGPEGPIGDSGRQFSVFGLKSIDNSCNWRKVDQSDSYFLKGSCEEDEVIRGIRSKYWNTNIIKFKDKWTRKHWIWRKARYHYDRSDDIQDEVEQHNRDYEICCSKLPIVNKKIELIELDETYDLSYPKKSDKEYNFYN